MESDVAEFSQYTTSQDFAVVQGPRARNVKVRKDDPALYLLFHLYREDKIPINRHRLWLMYQRRNGTMRPEEPLHWGDSVDDNFGYSLKTSFGQMLDYMGGSPLSFFLQRLPEVAGAGIQEGDQGQKESSADGERIAFQAKADLVNMQDYDDFETVVDVADYLDKHSPPPISQDDALLFFKYYDPTDYEVS